MTATVTLPDLERALLAGCLASTDVLQQVKARFDGRLKGQQKALLSAASGYFDITRGPLTRDALRDILIANEPNASKHTEYLALYDALTAPPFDAYTEANWRWILHQYDTEWKVNETGTILAEAAEAMRSGLQAGQNTFQGAEAAWQLLSSRRLNYDALARGNTFTEVEFTASTDQAKQDYHAAVQSKYTGVPLAIPEVMDALNGGRPGDFYLITAYAGEGKSFMKINDMHTAWRNSKNVVFASGEMSVKKIRNRFIALHAKTLYDEGKIDQPLETKKVDRGLLTQDEHEIYLTVLDDIARNPEYGKFYAFKFPRRSTPSTIFNRLEAFNQIVPIEACGLDYVGLLAPDSHRTSRREELDDILRDLKAHALDFAGGRGLFLEAGYQTNRSSYDKAREHGYYDLTCFAESSEAEKSCDAALFLLSIPQNPQELKLGFIKNRDDEVGDPFHAARNFKHAQVGLLKGRPGGKGTSTSEGATLLGI